MMRQRPIIWMISIVLVVACHAKVKDKYSDTPTSGVIPIAVDESFEPIIQQEIDVFEGIYKLAGIVPEYTSEVETINLLLKDSVRMAVTTRGLTQQERRAFESRKFFPREIKIATDGIGLIVNRQNPDSLISMSALEGILTGQFTRWQDIYPHNKREDIQLVFDHPNSSTVRFARDSLCGGKPLYSRLRAEDSNLKVIDYVAENPDAIGVVGVSWLQNPEDSTRLSFLNKIRVMGVSREQCPASENSYQPWQAYLALGSYPLTRSVYVILTEPRSGLASGFTTFLASDRGQRIILKAGLLPATQPVRIVNVREKL